MTNGDEYARTGGRIYGRPGCLKARGSAIARSTYRTPQHQADESRSNDYLFKLQTIGIRQQGRKQHGGLRSAENLVVLTIRNPEILHRSAAP